ncbi:MAG: Crp/Fnr family transcriptional regulator [Chitinophagaceae bacterium]|nr:Crp/Fnr family transcriptional regulator [Chitinophagaceae bacterium]
MNNSIFPHFEQELLDEIDQAGTVCTYPAGAYLVRKEQLLRGSFIIIEGYVKVTQENLHGDEFVIAYLKPGDSFAVSITEDSPIKNKLSLLTFTAIEPTKAITLPFSEKDRLAMKYISFYKYILQSAVMYYEFYLEVIDHIAFQNMESRIVYFLKRLSKIKQSNVITISHQEIADGLNSSREVVSRLLKKMEEAGLIQMSPNKIIIY